MYLDMEVDLQMYGAYALNEQMVKTYVQSNRLGNYAFGEVRADGKFYVMYVGRSDTDLQSEIISRASSYQQCTHFMYSYASSTKEAYEKECRNYHDCGESRNLLNKIHPDRPNGASYHCPRCGYPTANYLNFFKPLTYLK